MKCFEKVHLCIFAGNCLHVVAEFLTAYLSGLLYLEDGLLYVPVDDLLVRYPVPHSA